MVFIQAVVYFRNVTIAHNYASFRGGALSMYGRLRNLQFYCPPRTAGCDQAKLVVSNSTFVGNYAGDFGGSVIVSDGGVDITDTVFDSNAAPNGAGGAVYLVANGPLSGPERTAFTLSGVSFLNNTAASCASLGILQFMSAPLDARNIVARGNRALSGDGGAICIVPQTLQTAGTLGQTVVLSDHAGDVSLVPPGTPVTLDSPFTASWVVAPFPSCVASLVISAYMPVTPFQATFVVRDVATGAVLVDANGQPELDRALPFEVLSSSDAGLNITFAWAPISVTRTTEAGFRASYRNRCPLPGGAPGTFFLSDSAAFSLRGAALEGNAAASASARGGAMLLEGDPGFARARTFAVSLTDARVARNVAGVAGGGIAAGAGTRLTVADSLVAGNSAAGSTGGGLFLQGASSVALTNVTISNCSSLTSGGGIYAEQEPVVSLTACTLVRADCRSVADARGCRVCSPSADLRARYMTVK